MKRGDLEKFIRSYRHSHRLNAVLPELAQDQFPEIQTVGPEERIDLEQIFQRLKENDVPLNPSIHL